jgi:hypothetical protein
MHGLNELRLLGIVSQGFPQCDDAVRQGSVTDCRSWPQLRKQLSFVHYLPGMLDQITQDRKRLVGQLNRPLPTPQLHICQIESIAIKGNHVFWLHFSWCLPLHATS